jgi:hypothetical protein
VTQDGLTGTSRYLSAVAWETQGSFCAAGELSDSCADRDVGSETCALQQGVFPAPIWIDLNATQEYIAPRQISAKYTIGLNDLGALRKYLDRGKNVVDKPNAVP